MKTKKKFNLLCVLLLAVFAASAIWDVTYELKDYVNAFQRGWEAGGERYEHPGIRHFFRGEYKVVSPKKWDVAMKNNVTGKMDSVQFTEIYVKSPTTHDLNLRLLISGGIGMPFIIAYIILIPLALYIFIRLILRINRGERFNGRTTSSLRLLGWLFLVMFISETVIYLLDSWAFPLPDYSGLEVTERARSYSGVSTLVISLLMFIVAQFFDMGQKLKEEQDLTI